MKKKISLKEALCAVAGGKKLYVAKAWPSDPCLVLFDAQAHVLTFDQDWDYFVNHTIEHAVFQNTQFPENYKTVHKSNVHNIGAQWKQVTPFVEVEIDQ